MMPSRTAVKANSAIPTPGSSQVVRQTLMKKRTAQITAITINTFWDGSTACWRAYVMPVMRLPFFVVRSKRLR